MTNYKKYVLFASVLILFACNNTSSTSIETKDSTTTKAEKPVNQSISFKDEKLNDVYISYLALKDALVATKFDEAKSAAEALSKSLINTNVMGSILASTYTIAKAKDIATQRKEFTNLSNDMITLFKKSTLSSGTIFVQHCPMANEGEGGDWLASEKKIQNPYYGSEMMECGAVIEDIKSK
jgi:hypothetical protein